MNEYSSLLYRSLLYIHRLLVTFCVLKLAGFEKIELSAQTSRTFHYGSWWSNKRIISFKYIIHMQASFDMSAL